MNIKKSIYTQYAKIYAYLPWSIFFQKYPDSVTLEVTNACTNACEFCRTRLTKRKVGIMSIENFKTIINKLPSTVMVLRMNFAGEPLLNKDVFTMVKYAAEKGIKTHISTNGENINNFKMDEIINSGLDSIAICIDGATKETHTAYRKNSNFNQLIKNAKMLCEAKKKAKSEKPKIIQQTLINKLNFNEIEDIERMAKEIGFDILYFRRMGIWSLSEGEEVWKELYPHMKLPYGNEELKKKFLLENEYGFYEKKDGKYLVKGFDKRCKTFFCPTIFWNGDITVCCHDEEGYHIIGNLLKDDFYEIYKKINRRKIFKRKLNICKTCITTTLEDMTKKINS